MDTQNDSTALFDSVHPYYATEGNYFSNGYHEDYDSVRVEVTRDEVRAAHMRLTWAPLLDETAVA